MTPPLRRRRPAELAPYPSGISANEAKSRLAQLVGSKRRPLFELAFISAVAICLALAVQSWAVKPFAIPSGSMQPTLEPGQRVLVERFSTRLGGDPEIGDVVVFHPPLNAVPAEQDADEPLPRCAASASATGDDRPCPRPGREPASSHFIKRVVAGPGDRLEVIDGVPVADGVPIEGEWETVPCGDAAGCNLDREITVPEGHYFLMGDNRPASDDSRFWGPVPREWIIGEAFATYWPPGRAGSL